MPPRGSRKAAQSQSPGEAMAGEMPVPQGFQALVPALGSSEWETNSFSGCFAGCGGQSGWSARIKAQKAPADPVAIPPVSERLSLARSFLYMVETLKARITALEAEFATSQAELVRRATAFGWLPGGL
jgi:hypothetical protein